MAELLADDASTASGSEEDEEDRDELAPLPGEARMSPALPAGHIIRRRL